MKRLAILPARGGSKRIAYKNIKEFHGRPLISYALEAARNSGIFDTIHVSTEDKTIYDVCSSLGYKPDFMRTQELADDHTPIFQVLDNTIQIYKARGKEFDTICLIYPTAPLLSEHHITDACGEFEKTHKDRILMSVTEFPCPIEWAYRKSDENGLLSPVQPGGFMMRSQDLNPAFFDAAMFSFFSSDLITKHGIENLDKLCAGYCVPPEYVTDIDTPEDWKYAEKMYTAIRG